jgi:MinD-like ATPase involved in chromosome partitioning or flagellar assembly
MLQTISVGSCRRAVGKSTIAANLALQATLRGWRAGIADLNFAYPLSQNALFGIPGSVGSLANYVGEKISVNDVGMDVLASLGQGGGLWVFPWQTGSVWGTSEVDPLQMDRCLMTLARHHKLDFLILDLGEGMSDLNLMMAAISDCCLMITRADQMDYQGTAVMIDIIRSLDDDPWVLLLANQVLESYDFTEVREQLTASFRAPASVLPFSENIMEAASTGLFSVQAPYHPWSRAIRSISASLFSDLAGRMSQVDKPKDLPPSFTHQLHSFLARRRKQKGASLPPTGRLKPISQSD